MSGKTFLDSNIFIYAYDRREPRKQSVAADLIRSTGISGEGAISYQVIQEFFNFALIKSSRKMRQDDAQKALATAFRPFLIVPPSMALFSEGIRIQERYRFSWYDSLIVAAAIQGGSRILYSEDLQHGQKIGSLSIQDPFR